MAVADPRQFADRGEIHRVVIEILDTINADWDVGEIHAETRLGTVVPESISLVYLVGDLQHQYHLQDLLVQKLRTANARLTDLRVVDLVDMVHEILTDQATVEETKNG